MKLTGADDVAVIKVPSGAASHTRPKAIVMVRDAGELLSDEMLATD